MAEQIQAGKRQRELFIKKSTRVAESYLSRAKALSEMPDAAKPFFDVLENTYVKLMDIQKDGNRKNKCGGNRDEVYCTYEPEGL